MVILQPLTISKRIKLDGDDSNSRVQFKGHVLK